MAADASRCERIVGTGFGIAAIVALLLAFGNYSAWLVPVLFGLMGFASGMARLSRRCWLDDGLKRWATLY